MLEHGLLVLGVVVLGVLGDVAELACLLDALGHLAPLDGREVLDLFLQLVVPFGGENDFLHCFLQPLNTQTRGRQAPPRATL